MKSGPEIVKAGLRSFFESAADDIEKMVENLKLGKMSKGNQVGPFKQGSTSQAEPHPCYSQEPYGVLCLSVMSVFVVCNAFLCTACKGCVSKY